MEITEIRRRLEQSPLQVAEHLLPHGNKVRDEWEVGSVNGEPGKSMKVRLSGDKAGVWYDFAAAEGGDLIDLWRITRNITLGAALKEIKLWLGVTDKTMPASPPKPFSRPKMAGGQLPRQTTAVGSYLTGERKLSGQAIRAYRVYERGREMIFPSFRGSDLIFAKTIKIDRDETGKKVSWVEANCEPCLFGWQAIPDNARKVTICEGEIDAMTLWDYGFPALSVPFGGGDKNKNRWIEFEFSNLDQFEVIYVAMDDDPVGHAAKLDIVDRLGRHRCRVVTLPHKDANECRQKGVTKEEIEACFADARSMDPEELLNAKRLLSEVVELFYPTGGKEVGLELPFSKVGADFVFRPGELTIWTGATGSGKSQLLGFSCVSGMFQGGKYCIASLEMSPKQTLKRMAKQISGLPCPSPGYLEAIHDWYADKLWLYQQVGKADAKTLIEVFDYARRRYGVNHFVVDSLMRMGVGAEDYQGQEQAVYALTTFAVSNSVHVHLVAHSRKKDWVAASAPVSSEDIKGASEIGSNAANIIHIGRDTKLEQQIGKAMFDEELTGIPGKAEELKSKPSVWLTVTKQRNGDWTGSVGLWFDKETYQYRTKSKQKPSRFVEYSGAITTPQKERAW